MGFWQDLFNLGQRKQITLSESAPKRVQVVHSNPIGSSGTDLLSGILQEEYVNALQGAEGADIFDKMRRSDAYIKMCLMAITNPIKGATWSVHCDEENPQAEMMSDFVEYCLFEDHDKSWREFLHEVLTMTAFGYSLFERVHKVKDGSRWGRDRVLSYKTFAFRSQRTIEYWHVDDKGILETVEQHAYGDAQENVKIPAKFLTLFALDKEGDNFEGVSMLRPCYGAWLRKNTFLKLNAIGTEKFAVPTPILTMPEGVGENSDEYGSAINVLKSYLTHEQNYLTKPFGWDLELNNNTYDPSNIQSSIDAENKEIVNAFMANFLVLGQNQSGSYKLSTDLSDFFLGGIEHIAELICEVLNDGPVRELIDLNWGPQEYYPKLKCSGIRDKAGQELATIIKTLVDAKVFTPDDELEENLRKRYNLPEVSMEGQRLRDEAPLPGLDPVSPPMAQEPEAPERPTESEKDDMEEPEPTEAELAESKKKRVFLAEPKTAHGVIKKYDTELLKLMRFHLDNVGKIKARRIVALNRKNPNAIQRANLKKLPTTGLADYRLDLKLGLAIIALEALKQVQNEAPERLRKYKLADDVDFFGFATKSTAQKKALLKKAFGKLPPKIKSRVLAQAQELEEAQLNDLNKSLNFHYLNSVETIRDPAILESELNDAVDKVVGGPAVRAGAANTSSAIVNSTRNTFLFSPDIASQVESMTFTNPSPVTDICRNLVGKTFDLNDPGVQRYAPPLHHNCKSYLSPNFSGEKGNPSLTPIGLRPHGTAKQIEEMEKQITLSDRKK